MPDNPDQKIQQDLEGKEYYGFQHDVLSEITLFHLISGSNKINDLITGCSRVQSDTNEN